MSTRTFVVTEAAYDSFERPADAVTAALDRHALAPLARVAIHTGVVARRAEQFCAIANPGQLIVSSPAASQLGPLLPATFEFRDLGVHRLRDLSAPERVYEVRLVGDDASSPPLRSLDSTPNNLPVELTTFVGRDAELAAVDELLSRERLVTITGAGGSGKTRLAAHAAAANDRWVDGVWWIELQDVSEARTVADVIATGVGVLVEPVSGPLRSLTQHLRDRCVLVCLDNCDHVLDAAAATEALMATCPDVTVLATSREPLGVPGESVWRLPTLTADESVDLFVDRASRVRDDFSLDSGNEPVLRRLCAALDGIPLAIELAAAWANMLTPQQIEAGLDDRFALLVRSVRGAAARHQTLGASIDWSHELLDDRDRVVLRRLAVFRGGFTPAAALAVCDCEDVLVALRGLVDKSLVNVDERDGLSRFRLLETIRHYAGQRLEAAGELDATRDRHLDYMLAVAEHVEPELDRDKEAWRAVIEPELENLRAALDWGLSADDPDRGRRLAAATAWLWNLHGRGGEGVGVLRQAIERAPHDRSLLQARLLTGFALIGDTAAPGDLDPVREGESIAAELGDDRLRGRCLVLTAVGTFYNDFGAAWELCERALACATAAGDEFGADGARALEGLILHFRDRHDASAEILRPTVDRLIRRGDRGIASTVLVFQSNSALYTGDLTLAQQLADHAAHVAEPLRDYHRVGTTRTQVALLRGIRGDIDGGLQELEHFLHLVEGAGPEVFVPGMARTLGVLNLWRGAFDHAVRWLAPGAVPSSELADTHLDALGMPPLAESLRRLGRVSEAAAVLERARAMAERLDMPRVLADTVDQQAHLATVAGEPDRATDLHHAALAIRTEHGLRTYYIDSLEALGALMAATGREADAVALLAAESVARDRIGYRRRPIDDPPHNAVMATLEAGLGADTFARTWHAGCELALDDAVALARRTRGQRGRPTVGWASLTPTELEVVRLVADGLNNPQVAARLFMSRATVKTHLSHVFTKLGVANRTELATLATTRLTH